MELLPDDVLGGVLLGFLTHAEARCVHASCTTLRNYYGPRLRVHPWILAYPWCRHYFCANRRVAASVEPLRCARRALCVTPLVVCVVRMPLLYTVEMMLLLVCGSVWCYGGTRRTIDRLMQRYWQLETYVMRPFCCECGSLVYLPPSSLAIVARG